MKKRYTLLLVLFIAFISFQQKSLKAQIAIDTSYSPSYLVKNFLIGQGVIASNISYTGVPESIGYFDNGGTTNLGLDSGIVLSSGDVTLIPVVGANGGGTGKNINLTGHPLLQSLIPSYTTNDAVLIEFDFIPVSDTIRFRYIFGSDEYPEFVNSNYNDVFGFFITSGINPNTGMYYNNENIALIPGTTTPVTIDNVNGSTNSQYYVNNQYGTTIEYDGFTTVLTAWARVIPCTNYHIVIGVADAGDHIYDSGVFLEAYSFSSNSITTEKSFSNTKVDTMGIEGCNDVTITFRIPQTKSSNTVIPLSYSGTAQAGTDYSPLPTSVTIPAGQDSVSITINPLSDNIAEPIEVINIIFPRNCTNDTIKAYIKDNIPMHTSSSNDTTLCADSTVLFVSGHGGQGSYTYVWSTGDTTATSLINPSASTLYTVTTTDLCNTSIVDSIDVKVSFPAIQPDFDSICPGDTAFLTAKVNGGQAFIWSNGATTDSISVSPANSSWYHVTVTDSIGCTATDSVLCFVNPLPVLQLTPNTTICEGNAAQLQASGGDSYRWSTGDTANSISVYPSINMIYTVTATNNFGCTDSSSTMVSVNTYPNPYIMTDKDTVCRGEGTNLTAYGADYYKWSTGESGNVLPVSPASSTVYTVTASNILNGTTCSDTASAKVDVVRCNTYYIPNAFSPNGDNVNDRFIVTGQFKNVEDFEMMIFDRWGRLIFHTSDYQEGWRGRDDNSFEPMPVGTYIYKIRITEGSFEPIELEGSVILLR